MKLSNIDNMETIKVCHMCFEYVKLSKHVIIFEKNITVMCSI